MITIYHVAGYSRVDHFGPEIVSRAGAHHRALAEAKAAVKAAAAELPDAAHHAGLPRIDACCKGGNPRRIL
jgi:hypothetical protein